MYRGLTLEAWLRQEPFSLAMSSGFFAFFAHAGMLAALEEKGLRPVRVSGSSAGALVAGLWAAGVAPAQLRERLTRLQRRDFWDPAPGFGLLRGQLFREELRALAGGAMLEHCRVPVALSLFDVAARKTVVAARGEVATAIHASCAFPGLLQPVRWHGRWMSDGGIADRPGLAGLEADLGATASAVPRPERVLYHHIPSKSPWRTAKMVQVPRRPNLMALAIEGLPRLGPFALAQGPVAYERALSATRHALSQPADERGLVRVNA